MCLKSVETLDFAPLRELYTMRLIPGKGEHIANEADAIRRVELSICVSIAIMIFVAIVTGLLIRVFLHPLSDIARKMLSAAYMPDDSSSSAESSDNISSHANFSGSGVKNDLEAAESSKPKPKPKSTRILSNLTDVAAIQQAF